MVHGGRVLSAVWLSGMSGRGWLVVKSYCDYCHAVSLSNQN